jgi:hypothetical protein
MGSAKEGGGFTARGEAEAEGSALGIIHKARDFGLDGFDGGLNGLTALLG